MKIAPSVLGVLLFAACAIGATPKPSKHVTTHRAAPPRAARTRRPTRLRRSRRWCRSTTRSSRRSSSRRWEPCTSYLPKKIEDDTDIVLFASGDGGWEPRVVDMVVKMQARGQIVVGFSTPEYLKRLDASKLKCAYPPGELEGLSQFIQRKLNIRSYRVPVVVGYSSGASLAYVAMAQTPINAFVGAVALGFCPELALTKPLCRQGALTKAPQFDKDHWRLYPVDKLVAPLEVLQGQTDELCKVDDVEAFMKQVGNATRHVAAEDRARLFVRERVVPDVRRVLRRARCKASDRSAAEQRSAGRAAVDRASRRIERRHLRRDVVRRRRLVDVDREGDDRAERDRVFRSSAGTC